MVYEIFVFKVVGMGFILVCNCVIGEEKEEFLFLIVNIIKRFGVFGNIYIIKNFMRESNIDYIFLLRNYRRFYLCYIFKFLKIVLWGIKKI